LRSIRWGVLLLVGDLLPPWYMSGGWGVVLMYHPHWGLSIPLAVEGPRPWGLDGAITSFLDRFIGFGRYLDVSSCVDSWSRSRITFAVHAREHVVFAELASKPAYRVVPFIKGSIAFFITKERNRRREWDQRHFNKWCSRLSQMQMLDQAVTMTKWSWNRLMFWCQRRAA
jgi:hypothetical protein